MIKVGRENVQLIANDSVRVTAGLCLQGARPRPHHATKIKRKNFIRARFKLVATAAHDEQTLASGREAENRPERRSWLLPSTNDLMPRPRGKIKSKEVIMSLGRGETAINVGRTLVRAERDGCKATRSGTASLRVQLGPSGAF